MITKFSKGLVALTAIVAAAALTLAGAVKADTAVGFWTTNGTNDTGGSWNTVSNAVASAANGSGGVNVALFGVNAAGNSFVGVADDASGIFHGAAWNGTNGASTTPAGGFFDTGAAQGFAGNDTPWSTNGTDAVGQGVGQIAGYDQGFFAGMEWDVASGALVTDLNALTDPAGGSLSSGTYYGGPIFIESYDTTGGEVGNAGGINASGTISGTAFQNFGSFYYQGVIASAGKAYVIPYTDAADPAATSWNISAGGATGGYNFESSLAVAYGYTATVNTSGYSFGATGGTGTLNNYGQGPNNNFQWFTDNADSGNGSGTAVGFDIDSTGSYNHAVYDSHVGSSVEVADDRGGNTTFMVGIDDAGVGVGFETISADGEAYFHGWSTTNGTSVTDFPDATVSAIGSKFFQVAGGAIGPGVKTFTGAYNKKKKTYAAIKLVHSKPAKVSVILTAPAGAGGQVVTVTSSNAAVLGNFTITVPAGQTTVQNFKTAKVGKHAKGMTVTLTACAPGGCQSVTVTSK